MIAKFKRMGDSPTSRIFIKTAIGQTNLKLGVVITWVNSNVKKKIHYHSNVP